MILSHPILITKGNYFRNHPLRLTKLTSWQTCGIYTGIEPVTTNQTISSSAN
jgi:hypothetical protein